MRNVSDVPVKQLVPPEATLAQVHQEGPTTKNGFLRVAEATPPRSQRSANALQGPARRTGTPPPPASHVATGCPWTSRLQLLCIKQIETSASMLQKKAGSETMRADRLQIALHAARRLSNIDRPPSRILQAGRASREKFRGRRCDYSETPWAMNRSCNSAVTSRTLTLPSRKKSLVRHNRRQIRSFFYTLLQLRDFPARRRARLLPRARRVCAHEKMMDM